MSQPFVISMKIVGDSSNAVSATREQRKAVDDLAAATQIAETRTIALDAALGRSANANNRPALVTPGLSASAVDASLGIGAASNTAGRSADIAAYGAELDELKARYNPLFAMEQRHTAAMAGISRAHKIGAISADEQSRAIDREKLAHQTAIAAIDGHTAAVGRNNRANFQRTNLLFQLQDVGVSLAGGMNPLMVAAQQGSQISMIYGPGEGGLGRALQETAKMAGGLATRLWPIAVAAAAGSIAIGGMRGEIEEATGAAVSFGDVTSAVFQVIGDYIYTHLKPQIEAIKGFFDWVWDGVVSATKVAVNVMVATIAIFVEQVRWVHDIVPELFLLAGQQSANAFLEGMQFLVDQTVGVVDALGTALYGVFNQQYTPIEVGFNLKEIKFDTSGAEGEIEAVNKRYADTVGSILTTDYAGQFFTDVQKQSVENYNARLAETATGARTAAAGLDTVKQATKELETELAFYKDTFLSFTDDIRAGLTSGASLWEAFGLAGANALAAISERALSSAMGGVFDMVSSAAISTIQAGGPVRAGYNLPGYASGTNFHPGGPARVFEKGGEIINLPRGSQVIPHDVSMAMASSAASSRDGQRQGSGSTTNIFNVETPSPRAFMESRASLSRSASRLTGASWRHT